MPTELLPVLDITDVLTALFERDIDGLAEVDGSWRVATSYPDDVTDQLPFVLLDLVTGTTTRFESHPIVDIEIYATTREQAVSLDATISAYLLGYPRSVRIGERLAVIDSVTQTNSGEERPWDDSSIRRIASTYQFSVRR